MTNDIDLAFAHPEARAAATALPQPHDRISLRDHIVAVEIGAFQAERGITQRLSFNIVVEVAAMSAPVDDDVDRILNYDRVTEAIATELAAERLNLLETLAARIADRILQESQALRVFVRIEKLDRGPGALGVEIVRAKGDIAATPAPDALHPLVAYLDNAAIGSAHLGAVIDDLNAPGQPLILCVGLPEIAPPRAASAQRRIDLLAIEQNALALATRDIRLVVVETRTELDWAMKHGKIPLWAPSKIVLDAVNGPDGPVDPIGLAYWFAGQLHAAEFVIVGKAIPPDTTPGSVPVRLVPLDNH